MEELRNALPLGCNLVATRVNGKCYGMICSWATQVNTEELILCIGKQSKTGNAIEGIGEFSISVLASDQKEIAERFGSIHSNEIDKFEGLEYSLYDSRLPLIKGACKHIVCRLLDVISIDTEGYSRIFHAHIVHFEWCNRDKAPLLLDEFFR